jgi:hypothetical protein
VVLGLSGCELVMAAAGGCGGWGESV